MAEVKSKSNAKRSSTAKQRGPKAADTKGVQGHTLAASIIASAIKSGERVLAEQRSRKDTLRLLMEFRDNADHIAFRQDLEAKLSEVKADAEKATLSLNAYSEANPIAASIRAEVSLWTKMSNAVEKGFTGQAVDLDKSWGEISKAATAHLDNMRTSTGAPATGKHTNAGPKQRKAGRKAKPLLDKAKEFAKANLRDATTNAPLSKDNRNLANVIGVMCADATVDELNEVLAVVSKMRDMKLKLEQDALDKAKKSSADALKAAKDAGVSTTTTSQGATVTRKAAAGKAKDAAEAPKAADRLIEEGKRIVRATPSGRARAKA